MSWSDHNGDSFSSNQTAIHPHIEDVSRQEVKKAQFTVPSSRAGSGEGIPPQQDGSKNLKGGTGEAPPLNYERSCKNIKGGVLPPPSLTLVELFVSEDELSKKSRNKQADREAIYVNKLLRSDKEQFLIMLGHLKNQVWLADEPVAFPASAVGKLGYAIACTAGIRQTGNVWEELVTDLTTSVSHWRTFSTDRLIGFIEGWAKGAGLKTHLNDFNASQALLADGKNALNSLGWSEKTFDSPLLQFAREVIFTDDEYFSSAISTKELFAYYKVSTADQKMSEIGFARAFKKAIQDTYPDHIKRGKIVSSNNIKETSLCGSLNKPVRGWLGIALRANKEELKLMSERGIPVLLSKLTPAKGYIKPVKLL